MPLPFQPTRCAAPVSVWPARAVSEAASARSSTAWMSFADPRQGASHDPGGVGADRARVIGGRARVVERCGRLIHVARDHGVGAGPDIVAGGLEVVAHVHGQPYAVDHQDQGEHPQHQQGAAEPAGVSADGNPRMMDASRTGAMGRRPFARRGFRE